MLHMHEVEGSSPFETTIIQETVHRRHGFLYFFILHKEEIDVLGQGLGQFFAFFGTVISSKL